MAKERRTTADRLKLAAAYYFIPKLYSLHTEVAVIRWGKRRADLLALSMKGEIIICEVKSCREDYKADKKWREYLRCCDKLYFVVTHADWEKWMHKEDLEGAGVITLDNGFIRVPRGAKRQYELTRELRKEIILRVAWRGGQYSRRTHRRINLDDLREELSNVSKAKRAKTRGE